MKGEACVGVLWGDSSFGCVVRRRDHWGGLAWGREMGYGCVGVTELLVEVTE